jgi:hypothetical protein
MKQKTRVFFVKLMSKNSISDFPLFFYSGMREAAGEHEPAAPARDQQARQD